jgi:hypothetical protein
VTKTDTIEEPRPAQRQQPEPTSGATGRSRARHPLAVLLDIISSLRLTVVFLALSVLLVFIGTVAQVDEGLYNAQHRYFRSVFIWWGPQGANWRMPVFPGGYLVGGVLLINLLAAHARRFKLTKKKIGILVIHAGLILLLVGQFATDLLSTESAMHIFEGDTKSYSEDFRACELAIIDTADPQKDRVYSIPDAQLRSLGEIRDSRVPVAVRVRKFWHNADLLRSQTNGAVASGATDGAFKGVFVLPLAEAKDMDSRNIPAAEVEILEGNTSLGNFLVYAGVTTRQSFDVKGKPFDLTLRFARYYYPFSITLLKATHEKYKGTEEPKNYASRVRVDNPAHNEARETEIYMNNPLRYAGLTFFQYQMTGEELAARTGQRVSSTFQVVRNPSWLTPYVSCVLVAAGLIIQFMMHLVGFVSRRKA